MNKRYSPLLLALILAACGGGGGNPGSCGNAAECAVSTSSGGGNSGSTSGSSGSSGSSSGSSGSSSGSSSGNSGSSSSSSSNGMTFNPDPITVTVQAGPDAIFKVSATPSTPAEFNGATTLHGFISDTNNILSKTLDIAQTGPTTYTATLTIGSTVPAGTYTGTMTLMLCQDAGCATPYPGSPWTDPYTITVTPAGSN